ncbi:MAG TPA: hypothetical protein VFE25_13400 [Opitutaceae bacterium]|nr:hypothetical protein [Opitutaceae bacterium]
MNTRTPALTARIVAVSVLLAASAHAAIWVTPSGDDRNPGSEEEPLRTVARARDLVRTQNRDMADDITVFIAGAHHLDAPLEFGPDDSATNGFSIIYTAAPGEHPVMTGGYKVEGWAPDPSGHDLWVAPAPGGLEQADVLYVNGTPVSRTGSRLLKLFSKAADDTRASQPDSAAQWKNPKDVVFEPTPWDSIWSERGDTTPVYVRNAFELLGRPGEWYFDRPGRHIYYTPRPGEKMTSAIIEASSSPALVVVRGTPEHPVSGIIFKGLRFDYAGRPRFPGAAVTVAGAESVQFVEDEFLHMDTAALRIEGAGGATIDACLFADISQPALALVASSQIRILDSRFTYTALLEGTSGVINLAACEDVTIEHDQVDHFPLAAVQYSGAPSGTVLMDSNVIAQPMISFHGTPAESAPAAQSDAGVPAAYQSLLEEQVGSPTVPQPPNAVSAEAEDQFAYVTWIPSCLDGGSAVTGYTVASSLGAKTTVSAEDFQAKGYVVMGDLEDGSAVTFTVTATNSLGSSPASLPTAAVKPLRKRKLRSPKPPTAVSVTKGASGVRVRITPPPSDGGSPVISYVVSSGKDEKDVLEGLDVVRADATHPVERRIDVVSASISVTATNTSGEGDPAVVKLR